jgi:CMP-N,N'-diacetyllegionaminic acid synthase
VAPPTGLTVAVIPARGGSVSIPRKNLVPLAGRPLLAWSIDVARRVDAIDRIIVSTDDAEIARTAREHGAEVSVRPAALSTADAVVIDALRDLLRRLAEVNEAPRVDGPARAHLPAAEPRRRRDAASQLLEDDAVDSVATFKPAELNPHRAWRIEEGRPATFLPGVDPWQPRQRLPAAYQLNGAVYAFRADRLRPDHPSILFGRATAVVMPPERSIDIDGPLDLLVAESRAARRGEAP